MVISPFNGKARNGSADFIDAWDMMVVTPTTSAVNLIFDGGVAQVKVYKVFDDIAIGIFGDRRGVGAYNQR